MSHHRRGGEVREKKYISRSNFFLFFIHLLIFLLLVFHLIFLRNSTFTVSKAWSIHVNLKISGLQLSTKCSNLIGFASQCFKMFEIYCIMSERMGITTILVLTSFWFPKHANKNLLIFFPSTIIASNGPSRRRRRRNKKKKKKQQQFNWRQKFLHIAL